MMRDQVALVVPGAAAPDEAVLDRARERRLPASRLRCPPRSAPRPGAPSARAAWPSDRCPARCRAGAWSPTTSRLQHGMHLRVAAPAGAHAAPRTRRRRCGIVGRWTRSSHGIAGRLRRAAAAASTGDRRDRGHAHLARGLAPRCSAPGSDRQRPSSRRPAATHDPDDHNCASRSAARSSAERLAFGGQLREQRGRLPELRVVAAGSPQSASSPDHVEQAHRVGITHRAAAIQREAVAGEVHHVDVAARWRCLLRRSSRLR